ncbi:MAG: MFS transporter [Myxococcota bacterium]
MKALRGRLFAFAFADEFGPLYALYPVWFTDHGLTANEISWVFFVWAAVGLVAEVPSGAVADRVDRRRLIAFSLALRAVGISIWLLWPTLTGILLGASLWAIHSAFASGTWEALVHDQLSARGDADGYGPVMARIGQASHAGVALGIVTATVALHLGADIPTLGWVTVASHGVSTLLILSLPAVSHVPDEEPLTFANWRRTLADGLYEARHDPFHRRMIVLGSLLAGLFVLDEYQPLLAEARGVGDAGIPMFVLAIWVGLLLGGEVAARRPQIASRRIGAALAVAALVVVVALLSGSALALALLGGAYAVQNTCWIVADARFQKCVRDEVRATVSSVRAFFGTVVSMLVFAFIGVVAPGEDPTGGLLPALGLLAITGVLVARWLPNETSPASGGSPRRKAHCPDSAINVA